MGEGRHLGARRVMLEKELVICRRESEGLGGKSERERAGREKAAGRLGAWSRKETGGAGQSRREG